MLTTAKVALCAAVTIAATIGPGPATAQAATGVHCVQQVSVQQVSVQQVSVQQVTGRGGDVDPAPPPRCFATYPQAIAYLTGGLVQLSPTSGSEPDGSGGTAVDRQIARAEIANGVHVLSTEYTDAGYSGSTYTFTWTSDCSGIDVAWSSMPSGFDNTISSSHTGVNCVAVHYDSAGATPSTAPSGASVTCATYGSCSSLGTMNDKTSSMRWVP